MAGESRIDILINARDQAKGAIESVKSELGGIGQAAAGLPGLFNAATGALASFAAVQLGQQALEIAKIGAQAERLQAPFENLAAQAGATGDAMLDGMRKASKGTIADSALMLDALRARDLGVTRSAEDVATLLEIASARAARSGRTVAEAFDFLISGIGRGSAPILDNISIVLDQSQVMDAYAATLGKTALELTKAEQSQAVFNAVIASSKDIVAGAKGANEDSATSFERLSASVTNAKEALGKFLIAGGILPAVLGGATQVIQFATMTTDNWAALVTKLTQELGLVAPAADAAAGGANRAGVASNAAGNAMQWMASQAGAASAALAGLQAQNNAFIGGLSRARTGAVAALAGQAAGTKTDTTTRLNLYAEGIAKIDERVASLNQQVLDGALSQDQYTLAIAQLGTGAGDAFDAITQGQREAEAAANRFAGTMESGVTKAAQEAAAAFDNLKGKISGVLSGALGDTGGVNPDDILPRQDAINEDARRLADIAVKGFDSPWYAYFKDKFPAKFQEMFSGAAGVEGVKQQAAQLLKNFQDGLEPELLDKEKAKERVRRMLIGEANLAALAKEIATELSAELGNAAPGNLADTVNVALGVRGAGAGLGAAGADASAGAGVSGATAGSAFATAAAEAASNTGTKMISALDAQLRADANVNLIKQAGESAGTNWGSAFMTTVGNNVPKALIDLLSKLVTTDVIAYYNTQTQLTGATP